MSRTRTPAADPPGRVDPVVTAAALCRAVLLGRAAFALTGAGAGLLLVEQRWRVAAVLLVTAVATALELSVLTRRPGVVRRRTAVVAVDAVPGLLVLALSHGGMAYFCFAAGSTALSGALSGMRALPWWVVQAAAAFAVAAELLRRLQPPADMAAFVMALPMTLVLAGIGGATAKAALERYMDLMVATATAAQVSAAASERSRLARELHDSVAKTLRGVSFAALALPESLRRSAGLAEQLADTVSRGAEAASHEARVLVHALRVDEPGRPFTETVELICRTWSADCGIPVSVVAQGPDPAVDVRYEIARVLQESLTNVQRHARASRAGVTMVSTGGAVELTIDDDGVGCAEQRDPRALQAAGHFGIVGMVERASSVGGTVRVGPAVPFGTRVVMRVPAPAVAAAGGRRHRGGRSA